MCVCVGITVKDFLSLDVIYPIFKSFNGIGHASLIIRPTGRAVESKIYSVTFPLPMLSLLFFRLQRIFTFSWGLPLH
ncbi:hypothetical protein Taro_023264 [Colocasia esculenta]|uniref:Uncharacterized protein n=1 Tax=Colocasia esculenta TaxID=4460 RepID=A0A843V3E5_COLES|nr:hypothetical protein [Colocasia esculenta]